MKFDKFVDNFFQKKSKKGAGLFDLPNAFIIGAGAFFITLIIVLIFISQLNNASLLTANSAEANATTQLSGNITSGIANINTKIPTMFTIIAVVMLLGILTLLFLYFRNKGSRPM